MASPNSIPTKSWLQSPTSPSRLALRDMERAIPPGQPAPLPSSAAASNAISNVVQPLSPPLERGVYEAKPLPPVPQRTSMTSAISSEVNDAFSTPKQSIDYHIQPQGSSGPWVPQLSVIENELPIRSAGAQANPAPVRPSIDVSSIPEVPSDDILSPQPRQAVRKILQLTGVTTPGSVSPSATLTSPTGHNSPLKIRQLMGLDVDSLVMYPPAAALVSPVSPLSGSSVYSEDLAATISEPDAELYLYPGYSSEPPDSDDARRRHSSQRTSWKSGAPTLATGLQRKRSSHQRRSWRYSDPVSPLSPTTPSHQHFHLPLRHSRGPSGGSGLGQGPNNGLTSIPATDASEPSSQPAPYAEPTFPPPVANPQAPFSQRPTEEPLSSLSSQRHPSFSERITTSRVRIAPPPAPLRSTTPDSGAFATGKHPLRTPYPPKSHTRGDSRDSTTGDGNKSAFEHDSERSFKRLSALGRVFKRQSAGVNEIVSPQARDRIVPRAGSDDGKEDADRLEDGGEGTVDWAEKDKGGSDADQPPKKRTMFISNRNRKADGPDTPRPPPPGSGLVARIVGAGRGKDKDKAEKKRRASLKNKIRVVPEGSKGEE